ncbi:MAG TPA: hypothetical protein VIA81_03540, partial [Acidimicrobiia bacterium]
MPRLRAAVAMVDSIGGSWPRPFGKSPSPLEATVGGVEGRLFVGRAGGPGLLLVPGAAPAGLADPRTNRVAVTLCRAGRTVFVPALDLYRGRLDEGDIERLVACSGG